MPRADSNRAARPHRRAAEAGKEMAMPRAFWKGSLSFGLVEIPVTLRPALQSDELSFTLLDRRDFSPVGYRRYNKSTGKEVDWNQIVRGYEYEPDEYVVLTDEELKAANPKATQTIEILEFVDRDEIPPMFFDTPYFVEPLKKDSKSYALLRAALTKAGRVGIARVVLRTRQHLAALLVRDSVLMLDLLRYEDELKKPADLALPARDARRAGVSAGEEKMAEQLIDGMTTTWDPSKYKDAFREDILELVHRKVRSGKTHTITAPKGEREPPPRREVVDLMPLLKQSLTRAGRGAGRSTREERPARTHARTRTRERRHQRSA